MPSVNEPDGERAIRMEIEVPGTPEQVWQAVATAEGITAWFVPAQVDERVGGTITTVHGEGEEWKSVGEVTVWDPPHRFAYSEEWQPSAGTTPMVTVTEFLVEGRSGGTCVVRMVSSGFGSGDDWDRELEGMESGWRRALEALRPYLSHFAGQRCSSIMADGNAAGHEDQVWVQFQRALGISDAGEGDRIEASGPGAPTLVGTVERAFRNELLLRLDQPAPGTAFMGVYRWDDQIVANVHLYLFGEQASQTATRETPVWRSWMERRFPAVTASAEAGTTTA